MTKYIPELATIRQMAEATGKSKAQIRQFLAAFGPDGVKPIATLGRCKAYSPTVLELCCQGCRLHALISVRMVGGPALPDAEREATQRTLRCILTLYHEQGWAMPQNAKPDAMTEQLGRMRGAMARCN